MSIHSTIHGFIGRDATSRDVGKSTVHSFMVGCTSGHGDKAVTTWVSVSAWGAHWDAVKPHLIKGREVVIRGEMSQREYEKDGVKRQSLELRADSVKLCRAPNGKKEADEEVPF
jgi:single-stranded DNA-binding protein